jgi:predicted nucleotidyltransferase component of viral defense system
VLDALSQSGSPFYLSGGTALSRAWLHHRYSDDLDFFVNKSDDFMDRAKMCIDILRAGFRAGVEVTVTTDSYLRAFVRDNGIDLKIEFINDVPFRVEEPVVTGLFHRTDTLRNILSNKLSALERNEPKDMADILHICRHLQFHWREVIAEAKQKDLWVDEAEIVSILIAFSIDRLDEVKWIAPPDPARCRSDLNSMAYDISMGSINSLRP